MIASVITNRNLACDDLAAREAFTSVHLRRRHHSLLLLSSLLLSRRYVTGRLKYLFLCDSVVLHVKYGGNVREFYETGLESGVHYVGVNDVEGLPAAVEALRKDPARARRIAAAGQAHFTRMVRTQGKLR